MPWQSDAQRRWGNSPSGHKALGNKGVEEFNQATKGKKLPEKVKEKPKMGGIRHVGD
jgi:intein/homing endonuclease